MITLRSAQDRGTANFGWLDSSHSFSFGNYYDPARMGFASLRVINEDKVAPGGGFPTHGHRDMEIITYVLDGALEHKDSIGTGSIIRPGDAQRMSAGKGIRHSEYNASSDAPVHFLQIWILPEANGIEPGYEQKSFAPEEMQNQLCLIGSREGRDGSITIHQDVNLYAAKLSGGASLDYRPSPGRALWLQVARGSISLNGQTLSGQTLTAGDGAAITDAESLSLTGQSDDGELLLFDMAA
ncbi:MAG: pirin family protein [Synechococcales cyanobacterium RM1_1_8]|nr:pirin family protein [Synechococcales cyanobacterium RM1_1_8]